MTFLAVPMRPEEAKRKNQDLARLSRFLDYPQLAEILSLRAVGNPKTRVEISLGLRGATREYIYKRVLSIRLSQTCEREM